MSFFKAVVSNKIGGRINYLVATDKDERAVFVEMLKVALNEFGRNSAVSLEVIGHVSDITVSAADGCDRIITI